MLLLSQILIQNHELASFADLLVEVQSCARGGELFFQMDVKPSFRDTPADWELRLESAFTAAGRT